MTSEIVGNLSTKEEVQSLLGGHELNMDDALNRAKPLLDQWQNIDELSQIILKGHLVLEERLTRIIGKFVFHAELVQSAKPRFIQKIEIARSISLDEHGNRMWELFKAINELRNQLAHSLDPERRDLKTEGAPEIRTVW